MQTRWIAWAAVLLCCPAMGCFKSLDTCGDSSLFGGKSNLGPSHDRPFPLGAVTDAHWETQQTNAEAADFIFYDHEFVGETAKFTPAAKRHLEEVALRLEHVPFPVVIEMSEFNANPELDRARQRMVIEQLARLGVLNAEGRVVVANSFAEGFTSAEASNAYSRMIGNGFGGGAGRRFGGFGGSFR